MEIVCGKTSAEVLAYIEREYDARPEFLWAKTPNCAAIRHSGSKKWFAALMLDMPGKTIGAPHLERVDILDLKCDPLLKGSLVDGQRILPGYHMNKEHWITVLLDGSVPLEDIIPLIDMSYDLTSKRK